MCACCPIYQVIQVVDPLRSFLALLILFHQNSWKADIFCEREIDEKKLWRDAPVILDIWFDVFFCSQSAFIERWVYLNEDANIHRIGFIFSARNWNHFWIVVFILVSSHVWMFSNTTVRIYLKEDINFIKYILFFSCFNIHPWERKKQQILYLTQISFDGWIVKYRFKIFICPNFLYDSFRCSSVFFIPFKIIDSNGKRVLQHFIDLFTKM